MTARTGRVLRGGAATLLLAGSVASVASCGAKPDLTAAEAKTTYDPVLREVAGAASTATGFTWSDGTPDGVNATGDGCVWYSRTLKTTTSLADPSRWDEVIKATKVALLKHGFEAATHADLKGGYTGVDAGGDHDALLRMQSKGGSTLVIAVPVTDAC